MTTKLECEKCSTKLDFPDDFFYDDRIFCQRHSREFQIISIKGLYKCHNPDCYHETDDKDQVWIIPCKYCSTNTEPIRPQVHICQDCGNETCQMADYFHDHKTTCTNFCTCSNNSSTDDDDDESD